MKKLWIRWVALLLVVAALGAVFIRLGEWQLHRLDQRRERNASAVAHQQQPVKPWAEVMDKPITETDQWQRVRARGTFLADEQLEVRYRKVGDQQGSEWVVPFKTVDGRTVLVNRGLTAKQEGTVPPPAAVPSGEVELTGYVRRNEKGRLNATKPVQGSVRLINSHEISKELGEPLADGYIQLISSTPDAAKGLTLIGPPELTEGPHFSYAIQWFIFTVIAAAGALLLIRADLRDRRKRRARAGTPILPVSGATRADAATSAGTESSPREP
ncbi:SURF1 family protein [Aestuariimicrobium sp. p3-SID1156]|uniref:SURF1 family cytochrome oxidase biogenesis protein n=1 Tax=Aestuariimicrobium sp. p3-SID1156 TaxID=2916038 RepID=UPI00223ABBCF|nr:SURF1 family protein [Aestuariimicrobium sp. p3-SID1156]MCT1459709.1 SURF1 family protein [Aestuariimicrobium sp. p3-SID1156]